MHGLRNLEEQQALEYASVFKPGRAGPRHAMHSIITLILPPHFHE